MQHVEKRRRAVAATQRQNNTRKRVQTVKDNTTTAEIVQLFLQLPLRITWPILLVFLIAAAIIAWEAWALATQSIWDYLAPIKGWC